MAGYIDVSIKVDEDFEVCFKELKKKYGVDVARNWLESEWIGFFYNHDSWSTSFMNYCYAYDLDKLAKEGLYYESFNAKPPKHLYTFVQFLKEFISWTSNRSSGESMRPYASFPVITGVFSIEG